MFKACVFTFTDLHRSRIAAAFVAALLTSGCFGSGGSGGFGVSGKAKFGADSTVTFDRLEIHIQNGAVLDPNGLFIQIQASKIAPAAQPAPGPRYTMLPSDAQFAAPVTIIYHYAGLELPQGATENQLKLAQMGPTGLLTILPTVISTTDKTATTTASGFFTIALVAPPGAPPANGAGKLLFLRKDASGSPDLWSAAPDGSGAALVLAHAPGETISSPRISTIASRVAFTESVGGDASDTRVYIANLDGTGKTLVTADGSVETAGDLNAAGDLLYITHRDSLTMLPDIAVYSLAGAPPFPRTFMTQTSDLAELNPRIAPDGSLLVFQDEKGRLRRMVASAGAKVFAVSSQRVDSFAWSPDSKHLVVERPLGIAGGFGFGGGIGEISALSNTTFFPVVKGTGGARRPSYSPNGQQFLFEFYDNDPAVQNVTIRQITKAGAFTATPLGGALTAFFGESPVARP
ncbi:MAG: hypothetical protein HY286_02485 [Planctomycetes bacterium]|nr:hypothetical protein [Planctomycetota bacterium]